MAWLLGAALLGTACAGPPPPRDVPRRGQASVDPNLWRVLRADGTEAYFLLGSVHLGRKTAPRFPPIIEDAFARSEELVVEIDPSSAVSEQEHQRLMRLYAVIPPPDSLRDRVSSRTLVALDAYLEQRGEPLAPYLRFEPWALVELLGDEANRSRGLDPAHGIDRHFAERAVGRMRVVELETAESQLRTLAELPAELHELRLQDALAEPDRLGARAEAVLAAWERGDEDTLERRLFQPLADWPELAVFYEKVVFERNEQMAARLAGLARDGRLRFAVIGAGHLVGPRGIPALLHARGFRIQRTKP